MACAKFCRDQTFVLQQLRMFSQRETRIGLFLRVSSIALSFVYSRASGYDIQRILNWSLSPEVRRATIRRVTAGWRKNTGENADILVCNSSELRYVSMTVS